MLPLILITIRITLDLIVKKTKIDSIYLYNYVLILGKVFYEVFDKKGNKAIDFTEGNLTPFNTSEMFGRAYSELGLLKQGKMNNAFGANLIFMTLLENHLKTIVKNLCP